MPRPGRLDYGWAVVAGLCVTETVSWGIIYYGFPVMLRPMEAELGFSRAEITGAFSAGLAVAALAGLPVGRWIDRRGARSLMTVGSILATALVVLWASSHTLLALYSVWILMGLAMAAVLYEPAFAAIVGWVPARRLANRRLLGARGGVLRRQLHDELRHRPRHSLSQRARLLADGRRGHDRLDGRDAGAGPHLLRADRRAVRPRRRHRRDLLHAGGGDGAARPDLVRAHAGADDRHAGRGQRHGHARAGHGDRRHLRAAALRLHRGRHRARRQRRPGLRAGRRVAAARRARLVRGRLLAHGRAAGRRRHRGRGHTAAGAARGGPLPPGSHDFSERSER